MISPPSLHHPNLKKILASAESCTLPYKTFTCRLHALLRLSLLPPVSFTTLWPNAASLALHTSIHSSVKTRHSLQHPSTVSNWSLESQYINLTRREDKQPKSIDYCTELRHKLLANIGHLRLYSLNHTTNSLNMKSTLIATSLLASMALASPLNRRVMETDIDWFTVTVTVTGDGPAPTQAAWGGGGKNWGSWGGGPPATTQAPAATSSAAPPPPPPPPPPPSSWSAAPPPPPASSAAPPPPPPASSAAGWGSSAAASSSAPASSATAPSSYAQSILDQHNSHRQNASTAPLTWDDNMASIAQTIGQSCVYAHNT